jgi:predicted ATP-grasp superfamily ATP-dependent carboligase
VLGLTEQLIGENGFGVTGFRWCGNILPFVPQKSASIFAGVERAVSLFTHRFNLRGVNGIDIIVDDSPDGAPTWYFLEVNPRYTAAMELVEHAYCLNIFYIHIEAMAGRLPGFSLLKRISGSYYGKGVVFANQDIMIPETKAWLEKKRRDIPFPGDMIKAGHPVCTVFSQGDDKKSCLSNLLENASAVRREIGDKTED